MAEALLGFRSERLAKRDAAAANELLTAAENRQTGR